MLTKREAELLPLHDAAIHGMKVDLADDGSVTVSVKLEIHPDESQELIRQSGIHSSKIQLVFSGCVRTSTDLLGFSSPREMVDKFDIVEPSSLKEKMILSRCAMPDLVHYKIVGSSGSQLNLIAKSISIFDGGHSLPAEVDFSAHR